MKLKRLDVRRLPGIGQPFGIETPKAGVHVVFGPNAIGKSSICRAVEALYWEDRGPREQTSLTAEFDMDGETWRAQREGARLRWRCDDGDRARPAFPTSLYRHCFFLSLRDLIDPSPDGTRDVADEIRRQMWGGFDLRGIVDSLFPGVSRRHGRRQRDRYNDAVGEVQRAETQQSALQDREDELAALKSQLDSARSRERRLASLDRAIGLAGRNEEHRAVGEEIASMPEALASLVGDERERIDRLRKRIDEFDRRIRDLEGQCEDARDAAREARLPAAIDRSDLETWRKNADDLARVELERENARTDLGARRKEVAAALSAFGGSGPDESRVDLALEDDARLFEFLRAASGHRTRKDALEERLRLLANIEPPEEERAGLAELRAALDLLRGWLRAPDAQTFRDRLRARRVAIAVALAVAVAGAVMFALVDPVFAVLPVAAGGALIPLILLAGPRAASSERPRVEEAFARLDMEPPGTWQVGPVEARLRELEEEAASIDSRQRRARDRDVDRQDLESRLARLEEETASLDERRTALARSLGLAELRPDAELVDFARAVVAFREARMRHQGAAGRVDERDSAHARLLAGLTDVLARHGEAPPEDATTASARLRALEARNAQFAAAAEKERQAASQLEQARDDRDEAVDEIEEIYAELSLDLGDAAGLAGLLDALPRFRELVRTADGLRSKIDLDLEELGKAGESGLAELDRTGLESLRRDFSSASDDVVRLRDLIAEIDKEARDARRGTGLRDLIARREDARAELKDCRDGALFAAAGDFLVSAVETEYEGNLMPRVFERARERFSSFTHHGYRLRVGHGGASSHLFATDLKTGEPRQLDELSDGTRAQLLLAARIAFAEEVERRMALPLFLDEALDQSDPERFEAIARSLGRLASDGKRQIFYLTSDPADCERIQGALRAEGCAVAAEIDLAARRNRAVAVTEPMAFRVPTRPGVPSPAGMGPEQYAAVLGVPRFAPAHGYPGQHVFYLLSDDLDLLHAFLKNRIERAGQWATVSGTALAERLARGSPTVRDVGARVGLLEVFCALWNQGRGRLVDRDALARSGAVSDIFLDRVSGIADDLGGDAQELMAALRDRSDPRLSRFRRGSSDALEEYLLDSGCLDDRVVLDESGLTLRALASPSANELPEGIAGALLHRWWHWAATGSGSDG